VIRNKNAKIKYYKHSKVENENSNIFGIHYELKKLFY